MRVALRKTSKTRDRTSTVGMGPWLWSQEVAREGAEFISEASMLQSEHVAFYPRMANVDCRKGWAEFPGL